MHFLKLLEIVSRLILTIRSYFKVTFDSTSPISSPHAH
jgi:hypothetical protein